MSRDWSNHTTTQEDRRKIDGPRQYQPKQISERHRNILRLYALGYAIKEIAERLSCTPATVSNVVNSNLGRLHTEILRKGIDEAAMEAAKRVRALAPAALSVIEEILEDETVPSAVRLRAAQDALDRAGFGAVKKMDVHTTSLSLTPDDLAAIKAQAMSRAAQNGMNDANLSLHLSLGVGPSGPGQVIETEVVHE